MTGQNDGEESEHHAPKGASKEDIRSVLWGWGLLSAFTAIVFGLGFVVLEVME